MKKVFASVFLGLACASVDAQGVAPDPSSDVVSNAYVDRIRNVVRPRYPGGPDALARCPKGVVKVWFVVARDGLLIDRGLVETSGSVLLDRAGLSALDRTRFPIFPADLVPASKSRRFTLDFDFSRVECVPMLANSVADPAPACEDPGVPSRPRAFLRRAAPRLTDEERVAWARGGTVSTRVAFDRAGMASNVDIVRSPSPALTAAVMAALAGWQVEAASPCNRTPLESAYTFVFTSAPTAQVREE